MAEDSAEDVELALGELIAQSPPQQLPHVLELCRRLSAPQRPPEELFARCCRDWNEANLLPLNLGDGSVGIVCRAARLSGGANRYLDLRRGRSFEVEHLTQLPLPTFVPHDDLVNPVAEPYRAAVDQALDGYLAQHYGRPGTVAAASSFWTAAGQRLNVTVALASRHHRPRGCWACTWTSQWELEFSPGQPEQPQLEGKLLFASHFYEEGNVQFRRQAQRGVPGPAFVDPTKFADALVKAIGGVESDFHLETDDACLSMSAGRLKALRRVLPLSKERFDWRPFRQALVRDLNAAVKEGGC